MSWRVIGWRDRDIESAAERCCDRVLRTISATVNEIGKVLKRRL
jgi:hypothetical protein